MDDDDGAFAVEMMAGQDPQAILQTIYNGSATCQGCGCTMTPVSVLYGGSYCPDCTTQKSAKHVQNLVGR